jgi:serine/threonine protein phosphatase 1
VLSYLHVTGRTLIMGDLHGCYQQLLAGLSRLKFAPERGDCLIALGDLTDRGADNLACLRLLLQPWFHTVRGNHEQLMLTALLGGSRQARQLWFCNGGRWYERLEEIEQAEIMSLCHEHINRLPYAMEITTRERHRVGVVHADPVFNHWQQLVECLRAPSPDPEVLEQLLWQRARLNQLRKQPRRSAPAPLSRQEIQGEGPQIAGIDLVCLGHTPLSGEAPWASGNILWLDNGTCAGHELIILDADSWLQEHPLVGAPRTDSYA